MIKRSHYAQGEQVRQDRSVSASFLLRVAIPCPAALVQGFQPALTIQAKAREIFGQLQMAAIAGRGLPAQLVDGRRTPRLGLIARTEMGEQQRRQRLRLGETGDASCAAVAPALPGLVDLRLGVGGFRTSS